jgi:hypothetical protein
MKVNFDTCLSFLRKIEEIKEISIDFITPCGIAILHYFQNNPNNVKFSSSFARNYAKELFNESDSVRDTAVPLEELSPLESNKKANAIENIKVKLLNRLGNNDLKEHIGYLLNELVDNAFEHANANRIIITGQAYPNNSSFQIAILDDGIGFLETLKKFPDVSNDLEAIQKAIKPGVTRKIFEGNNYGSKNQGFGLFAISQITRFLAGKLWIISYRGALKLEGTYSSREEQFVLNQEPFKDNKPYLKGSLLVIDLPTKDKTGNSYLEDFDLLMKVIRSEINNDTEGVIRSGISNDIESETNIWLDF